VDNRGTQPSGDRASKTLALRRRIYDSALKAYCALHTHATHLVALTMQCVWRTDDILPPLTPYQVMKVGHVPLIAYRYPGDPAAADAVAAHLAAATRPLRAVMLERLGPAVWHDSPSSATASLVQRGMGLNGARISKLE